MSSSESIVIPSDEEFIRDKQISDRVYSWIVMNAKKTELFSRAKIKPKKAHSEIGIDRKTFISKTNYLVEKGYLDYSDGYYIVNDIYGKYKRYIYKETIEKLLETRIDNIIKVYSILGSLYDSMKVKGGKAYFRYNDICKRLGYYEKRDSRNIEKVKEIVKKLMELGLIEYKEESFKVDYGYQINCVILSISKKCKKSTEKEGEEK